MTDECQYSVDNCYNERSGEHAHGECSKSYIDKKGGSNVNLSGSTCTKNSTDTHPSIGSPLLTDIAKEDGAENGKQLQLTVEILLTDECQCYF